MGPNYIDEIDCGNFFDQIDDLIDFPPDDNDECGDANLVSHSDCKNFPTWDDALQECDPLFPGSHADVASDLSAQLSVPYEDILQLEWLSTFVEESFSGEGLTLGKENLRGNTPSTNQFQISSPVSVLESSSSSSSSFGGKTIPLSTGQRGPQRARSKRPRPPTFNPRPAMQLISSSAPHPFINYGFSSESDESPPVKNLQKPEQRKPKKIKITLSPEPNATSDHELPGQAVRKCLHCEITKTPQWRAGPLGPKTLCNACGVRYKSGRLYPEYRPAASPTFVPSVHSNSHKKVLEMRTKIEPYIAPANTEPAAKPELVPAASLL